MYIHVVMYVYIYDSHVKYICLHIYPHIQFSKWNDPDVGQGLKNCPTAFGPAGTTRTSGHRFFSISGPILWRHVHVGLPHLAGENQDPQKCYAKTNRTIGV